jgi:hypothetical protein
MSDTISKAAQAHSFVAKQSKTNKEKLAAAPSE